MSPADRPSATDRVAAALDRAEGALDLAALVERTGLHPNAVRRALAALAGQGRVHADDAPPTGGRGRPRRRYRAVAGPERPYRELLPLVLGLLGGGGDPEAAHAAGRAHGLAAGGPGPAGEAVVATLASLGFAPSREDGRIALRTCPFAEHVVRPGGRALCSLHHGILAGVAEAHGGSLTDFTVADPRRAPCTLTVRDAGPADQAAPNPPTSVRKTSPRST